jgi:hypothetical protein
MDKEKAIELIKMLVTSVWYDSEEEDRRELEEMQQYVIQNLK